MNYHITKGIVRACTATVRACPLGEANHFATLEAANEHIQDELRGSYGTMPTEQKEPRKKKVFQGNLQVTKNGGIVINSEKFRPSKDISSQLSNIDAEFIRAHPDLLYNIEYPSSEDSRFYAFVPELEDARKQLNDIHWRVERYLRKHGKMLGAEIESQAWDMMRASAEFAKDYDTVTMDNLDERADDLKTKIFRLQQVAYEHNAKLRVNGTQMFEDFVEEYGSAVMLGTDEEYIEVRDKIRQHQIARAELSLTNDDLADLEDDGLQL